jgi:cyclopropane fatty-acyl-phospholipid synthase-like methyltransferase
MINLEHIFNKRAEKLNDHDPWRYGAELSLKTDLIEIAWIRQHIKKGNLLDMGCGTGRHCIELSKIYPKIKFDCFDFASNNIKVFDKKIKKDHIKNITTKICGTSNMADVYKGRKFNNILSIGLIQYLNDKELKKYFNDCWALLNNKGVLMIKHPTSYSNTFVFEGYSDFLQSEYMSKYRNFQDIIRIVNYLFEIKKIELVFHSDNLDKDELKIVERDDKVRQLWFLLQKKI